MTTPDLERQLWDLLEAGGLTRDMLERHLPRCSPEAIRIKVLAMKGRGLVGINVQGQFMRVAEAYKPAFVAVARSSDDAPPRETVRTTTQLPVKDRVALTITTEHTNTPSEATTNEVGGETHMADTKKCPQCKQTKAKSEFGKHQRRCRACLAPDGERVAPKKAKALPPATRKKRANVARTNGHATPDRDRAFHIPAGREIDVDVIRGDDGIRLLELSSCEPGKKPDQFLNLTRDQAILLYGWLGHLLAAQ